eukprot:scaffold5078_cov63-Phaeocystis_antarctica.AAC.13
MCAPFRFSQALTEPGEALKVLYEIGLWAHGLSTHCVWAHHSCAMLNASTQTVSGVWSMV